MTSSESVHNYSIENFRMWNWLVLPGLCLGMAFAFSLLRVRSNYFSFRFGYLQVIIT
jgi:hypothetical protein